VSRLMNAGYEVGRRCIELVSYRCVFSLSSLSAAKMGALLRHNLLILRVAWGDQRVQGAAVTIGMLKGTESARNIKRRRVQEGQASEPHTCSDYAGGGETSEQPAVAIPV
jgi:hypothetical protein